MNILFVNKIATTPLSCLYAESNSALSLYLIHQYILSFLLIQNHIKMNHNNNQMLNQNELLKEIFLFSVHPITAINNNMNILYPQYLIQKIMTYFMYQNS